MDIFILKTSDLSLGVKYNNTNQGGFAVISPAWALIALARSASTGAVAPPPGAAAAKGSCRAAVWFSIANFNNWLRLILLYIKVFFFTALPWNGFVTWRTRHFAYNKSPAKCRILRRNSSSGRHNKFTNIGLKTCPRTQTQVTMLRVYSTYAVRVCTVHCMFLPSPRDVTSRK